ncbi:peptidoglycan DD-metalloendopeptidase family protein [candidate division KSB1 bacterium]|nr:peptidoglycan DD-metalloendopeptidase family protein [candidate division KSB1 bacterium]
MLNSIISFLDFIISGIVTFLIRESLYVTLLFGVIYSVTLLLRNKHPRIILALWSLLFIRLILPPSLSLPFSGRQLCDNLPFVAHSIDWVHNLVKKYSSPHQKTSQLTGYSLEEDSSNLHHVKVTSVSPLQLPIWRTLLFLSWIMGFCSFFYFYIHRKRQFNHVIRQGQEIKNPDIIKIMRRWRSILNIRRNVEILSSDSLLSPFTIGFLKPVVVIPTCVLGNSNLKILETVIAHELVHIKRYDDVTLRIISIIQLIYFFHPLVWFARRKWLLNREFVCDNIVLSHGQINPLDYGRGLMSILNLNLSGQMEMCAVSGFQTQKSEVYKRILLLKGAKPMNRFKNMSLNILILLLALIILPMAGRSTSASAPNDMVSSVSSAVPLNSKIDFKSPIKSGKLTAAFGNIMHPIKKSIYHHDGIDIAAKLGTTVHAAADGVVLEANLNYKKGEGSGRFIVIKHNDSYTTRYTHLDEVNVVVGQRISQGEQIGTVGNTGLSTGAHLHFEIVKDGTPQNPADFIDLSGIKKAE